MAEKKQVGVCTESILVVLCLVYDITTPAVIMEKTLKFGKNQLILTNERYKLNFDNISRLGAGLRNKYHNL